MSHDLSALKTSILETVQGCGSLQDLETIRVQALGKKGQVTELMKQLGSLPAEERREFGANVNAAKQEITNAIEARRESLQQQEMQSKLATERLDMTLPIRPEQSGSVHPVSQTIEEVLAIFNAMGFDMAEGPQVEDDWHNFTALNIPPFHPAREMQDTFYLNAKGEDEQPLVLRTQTSNVQIRSMTGQEPPFRLIAPGRVYRHDSDATHSPMFHQFEGLVIDRDIHMGHLKGCLLSFLQAFFGVDDLPIRFRPSHFPFTEPSAEIDIGCRRDKDALVIGQGSDWLEVGGCGMVHPNVLKNCGVDPDKWQGFAFGMGIDRLAMLKYGIPDLRTFFEGDVRWLSHYGFGPLASPNMMDGI